MAELIVVDGENEHRLLFETAPESSRGGVAQAGLGDWLKDTIRGGNDEEHAGRVADIATTIQSLAKAVAASFDGLATDKSHGGNFSAATVEFGIKVSAEGNTFVTKAGVEANLKVSIEWDFS